MLDASMLIFAERQDAEASIDTSLDSDNSSCQTSAIDPCCESILHKEAHVSASRADTTWTRTNTASAIAVIIRSFINTARTSCTDGERALALMFKEH